MMLSRQSIEFLRTEMHGNPVCKERVGGERGACVLALAPEQFLRRKKFVFQFFTQDPPYIFLFDGLFDDQIYSYGLFDDQKLQDSSCGSGIY